MNLLIVDDIATNRKLLRVTLEAEGHLTFEAADGVEALAVLAAEKIDAVISDILMPNMDGFRLCQEVRKIERLRALPFIIYTSTYTSSADMKLAQTVGADKFITKPAPTATVLEALREAIEARAARPVAPALAADENDVLRQHNQAVSNKLEKKNAEFHEALVDLQSAHSRIVILNGELEQRVQERTAELAKANEKLQRQNDEIQNYYHTLSHELKTPLTSAREFISIVMDGLAGTVSETQSEYLGYARESCDQLTVCVNDLMDAARLETGKMAVFMQTASLGEVAHRVVIGLRSVALAKRIDLQFEAPAGLPEATFDDTRITQVISNLLFNAAKFTPEGGSIRVAVTEAPGHPEFLQVAVSDTGQGIPKEQLAQIFDRLYQIKAGDAATEKGIGMGLYICRELVHLHNGEIWVESEPGKGSTFKFTVPLKAPPNPDTILIVDDEAGVRDVTRKILEQAGFTVRTAKSGHEALVLMERELPSVLILDLGMPEMDGAATLKQVRKTWSGVPVIMHTGYATGALMDRALESSPFTVLAKPCAATQLVQAVKQLRKQSDSRFWKRSQVHAVGPLIPPLPPAVPRLEMEAVNIGTN